MRTFLVRFFSVRDKSKSDIHTRAGITGDLNAAHINEQYAEKTFFKTRTARDILCGNGWCSPCEASQGIQEVN
jgi:acyl dehydratase